LQILVVEEQTAFGNYVQRRAPLKPSGQPSARRGNASAAGLRVEHHSAGQPTNQASEPTERSPEATCTPPAGAEGPVLDGITQKGISQSFHRCIG
jgi:hypothetical protein